MISASTNEMFAPRRYDVAGFLLAGRNRLLFASIDASQAGCVIGQRLPTRSTRPTRFIGVPGRTASRVTGAGAQFEYYRRGRMRAFLRRDPVRASVIRIVFLG
jgi:hypothetical protein